MSEDTDTLAYDPLGLAYGVQLRLNSDVAGDSQIA